MITLHIIAKNSIQAIAIAKELFKRNYIIKAMITENTLLIEQDDSRNSSCTLLIIICKAVHSSDIAVIIKQLFSNDEPMFYALPIINTNIKMPVEYSKSIK